MARRARLAHSSSCLPHIGVCDDSENDIAINGQKYHFKNYSIFFAFPIRH